jgi:hypothetical protein
MTFCIGIVRVLRRAGGILVGSILLVLSTGTMRESQLAAQIGIEGVFKDITDVSLFTTCWEVNSPVIAGSDRCPFGEHAFGFEVSFRIREVALGRNSDTTYVKRTLKGVEQRRPGVVDSIFDAKVVKEPKDWFVLLELGLGYSQIGGFRSAVPQYDLRGTVREAPSVSLYGTLESKRKFWDQFGVYGGLRTGLAQFRDLQTITPANSSGDTVSVYLGDAQTFQIGFARGIVVEPGILGNTSLYAEWTSMYRKFSSVKWTGSSGGKIPAILPRSLDFSGDSFSLGVQVNIR